MSKNWTPEVGKAVLQELADELLRLSSEALDIRTKLYEGGFTINEMCRTLSKFAEAALMASFKALRLDAPSGAAKGE